MQTLTFSQAAAVSGGVINNPIQDIGWGFAGYGYGLLLGAAGLEGGVAAFIGCTAVVVASELPALPPPTEGGAFYVHKQ